MTNEQLAEFIQEGDSDLKPVLWERVKKLLYMFSGRYYRKYTEYCERCGVTEWDLKQQAYSAFELSLQGYSSERGAFSTYLTFGFKRSLRELFKSKEPLNTADSLNEVIGGSDNDSTTERGDLFADEKALDFVTAVEDADESEYIKRTIRNAVDLLPEDERMVINEYYFNGKTYKAIAEDNDQSIEYIRQRHGKALKKLRKDREINRLGDDLGYGSRKAYCNSFSSFNRFGISGVERVAIDRADIEARRAARDAAMQEYERISEKLRAGEITFAEYKEQTKDAVEFLVYS